jgi:hypothetical protein
VAPNSLDAVSDRDYILKPRPAITGMHLSRLATDLPVCSGFAFVEIADACHRLLHHAAEEVLMWQSSSAARQKAARTSPSVDHHEGLPRLQLGYEKTRPAFFDTVDTLRGSDRSAAHAVT